MCAQTKKYQESINAADEMLDLYPNSIFKRDALLYKIRAMHRLGTIQDDISEFAKDWLRAYPTDISDPEVLFIVADSYNKMKIYNEARYDFDYKRVRILEICAVCACWYR